MSSVSKGCSVDGCSKKHHTKGYCGMHAYRMKMHGDPNKVLVRRDTPAVDRFWDKVDKSGACWEWQGTKSSDGYGNFTTHYKGKTYKAHRFSYEQLVEKVPDGMVLDHICHNRSCVNPDHLRVVTRKQNGENRLGPRSDNTTGFLGVHLNKKTGRYYATVVHNGKAHSKYGFTTAEEADVAVRKLRIDLYTHNDVDRKRGTPIPMPLDYRDEWFEEFKVKLSEKISSGCSLTADDMRKELPEPGDPSWWGVAFRAAASRGLIQPVSFETSRHRSRRGGSLRRWVGVKQRG